MLEFFIRKLEITNTKKLFTMANNKSGKESFGFKHFVRIHSLDPPKFHKEELSHHPSSFPL